MSDVLEMFWANLPAICFGALGAGLVVVAAIIVRDRRGGRW